MSFVGKTAGKYRIESLLGEGAMGEVYLARHVVLGKRVAVKVLRPELSNEPTHVSRFFREAKIISELGHQHLADVVDYGMVDDTVYLAMEFLEGRTLSQHLSKSGVTIGEALHIVAQCCDVLTACHGAGIVHRDLKPENVFLIRRDSDRLFVKILDFGVAKLLKAPAGGARTDPGQLFGTPAYMSPEQAMGKPDIDARADIYSLGSMLYEMLVGETPFESAPSLMEMIVAQISQEPTPPSKRNPLVPHSLDALVLKALEKDPAARFQTAEEMAQALRTPEQYWAAAPAPTTLRDVPRAQIAIAVPVRTLQTTRRRRSLRGARAHRRWLFVVGASAVAIAAIAGVAVWQYQPAPRTASETKTAPLVNVRVVTTPDGAVVLRDGVEVGRSPLVIAVRRGQPLNLGFEAAGFQRATQYLIANENSAVAIQLAPAPPPPSPRPPPNVRAATPRPLSKRPVAPAPPAKTPIDPETGIIPPVWK